MKTLLAITLAAGTMLAGTAQAAVVYTADHDLAHFTNGISDYATFSNFRNGDYQGDHSSVGNEYAPGFTYTPTTATLNHDYRVFNWTGDVPAGLEGKAASNNWVLATFTDAESAIRVFANIDHDGANYDGYQYTIWGYNGGNSWTELFDAIHVTGSGEPFTLGSTPGVDYFGTAPTRVNNVKTPGAFNDAGGGTVGYIADFHFSNPYSVYAFGTSTIAGPSNPEQEFSAVASIPEPASWALMILGFGGAGAALRRRRQALAA
jgi:hypothetical protein